MQATRLRGLIGVLCAALCVAAGCEAQKSPEAQGPGALPKPRADVTPRLTASTFLAHAGLLERQGNYPAAAEQYARALELSPDLVMGHNRRGIVLNRLGRHDEATVHFRRAIVLQPRDPQLHNNLGFSLLLQGDLVAAEQELARALELDPTFRRARMNHALVLGKLGRDDDALAEFRLAGSEADALYNLAVIQADRGRYADAARSLEQALRLHPDFADAREQLRRIARQAALEEAAAAVATDTAADSPALAANGPDLPPELPADLRPETTDVVDSAAPPAQTVVAAPAQAEPAPTAPAQAPSAMPDIQPAASIEPLPAPRSVIERCTPQTLTDADRRRLAEEIRQWAQALYGPLGAGPRRPDAVSNWYGTSADGEWLFSHRPRGKHWFGRDDPQP